MANGTMKMERRTMSKKRKLKRISVSSKRQISIPKEFHDHLNISDEVTVELVGDHLVITPIRESMADFSDEILADLVKEGYVGEQLILEFKRRKSQIGPAIEMLVNETSKTETTSIDELFGDPDE